MAKQLNVNLAFTADTAKVKSQLQDLQNQLSQVINMPGTSFAGGITDDIQRATQAAAELKVHLQNATNVKTGTLDFAKLNQSIKNSGSSLSEYAKKIQSIGPEGQKAFALLAQSVASSEVPIRRSNALLTELWTTMKNTARWQLTSSMLHGFMGAVQSAVGYTQDLNESLNNIRIVTGQSVEQMAKFAEKANKSAKALSTTTTEYTNASLIYYQQGLSDAEVQARTDITIKMAQASGQSAEVVSDQLTALWNNFYDGSQSLEHFADVLTKLGAETASSSDEISTGLEKFAAIGDMIGLSYDNAAAALATVTAQTRQSADVVGTAFKTIFARIQGLSLGETLEDGTDLNKYSEALQKVGISIFDQNGELKDMDNIIAEMGAKWKTLSKDQQVALSQTVAGVRQYNQLVAFMDNFDYYEELLESAKNSEGSLQEQADIYAESWEAASDRVEAALQGLYDSIINDEAFIDFLNVIEKIISGVEMMADSMGGFSGIISALGVVFTNVFRKQITQSLTDASYSLKSWTEKGRESIRQEKKDEMQKLIDSQQKAAPGSVQDVRNQVLIAQLESQQNLIDSAKELTDHEQRVYQVLLDQQKVRGELAIKAAEQAEAAKKAENKARSKLYGGTDAFGMEDTANLDEVKKAASRVGRNQAFIKEHDIRIDKMGEYAEGSIEHNAIKNLIAAQGQLTQAKQKALQGHEKQTKAVEEYADRVIESVEAEREQRQALSEATREVKLKTEAEEQGAQSTDKAAQSSDKAAEAAKKSGNAEKKEAAEIEKNTQEKKENAQASEKMGQQEEKAGQEIDETTQDLKEQNQELEENTQKKKLNSSQTAQNFVAGANAAMSMVSAMSAVSSMIDTINSDAEPMEKLPAVLMSGGMAAGMFANSITSLNKITVAGGKTLGSLAASSGLASKALSLIGVSASSTLGALLALGGYVLIAIGIIAGLVAIGKAIADKYNEAAIALERANGVVDDTTTSLNEATDAAKAFKDELSSYDDAVDKLKDTSLSAKELAEASKEASEQAQDLIEKYKLFDKANWKLDKFGNAQLTEEGKKKLKEIGEQKDRIAQRAESVNTVSKINQTYAEVNDAATNIGRDLGYTVDSNQGTQVRAVSQDDVKQLGAVINQVRDSMGGITPDAQRLKEYIVQHKDELSISTEAFNNLDQIITDKTIDSLTTFADKLTASEEAIDYFNKKLLGDAVEQTYGDTFSKIATDEKTGELDEGLYNLMNDAATTIVDRGEAQVSSKGEEYNKILSDVVLANVSDWDAADRTETNIQHLLSDVFGDFSGTDYTSASDYLHKNYDKIFEGTTTNFADGLNSSEMAQAYYESKGITVTSTDNQWGKTVLSGTDQEGKTWTQTVDNDKAQMLWAEQVAAYAINERLGQLAEEQISEEELGAIFEELRDKGEQYGADFTTAILSGIANRKDGEDISFDFTSLFGDLTQGEVDSMLGMSDDALLQTFGFTEDELKDLGFDTAKDFTSAFKDALEDYDSDIAFDQAAADLGMTSDALKQYVDHLQDNNEVLKDNEDLARDVAKAQIPLHRNIEKAGKVYKDNSKALDKVNEGTEEYATACSDMASALNDVFGEGVFDATMVADNLETVKKAMEGDVAAYEKLQDLAGEKLLIDAGVNIDEGVGQEINDWIGSQQFNDLEIGATLDSSGMDAAFQALLDSGAVTVDQMNSILKGIGFEPKVDYIDVPLDQAAYNKDTNTYTVQYLDSEGNEQTKTLTADQYNEARGAGSIQVPVINGGETLKVSSPKAAANAAKTGSGGGGGGGKKSTPAKPVKFTKKEDVVDRYKEQDDALDDIEEKLEDINREKDRAYGANRLKQMDKEQEALLEQKKAIEEKAKAAKQFYDEDKKNLKDKAKEYGLNLEFDDLGNIVNYTTEMTKLFDQLHAAEEEMDKMSTKEAQDEFQESTVQPIQDKIDELKKLIEQYDETKELMEDLEDEVLEALYAWQDSNYEELQLKLELKLEINDDELKMLEFRLKRMENNFYKMAESAAILGNNQVNNYKNQLQVYEGHKASLDAAYAAGEISEDAYMEGIKEVRDGIYEQLEALIDLDDQMMHYYRDTLEAASEEIADFTDHMEHLTGVFDHYLSLMEILGKQKNYSAMGDFLDGKADTIKDRLDVAKEYYDMLKENSKADEYWTNYQNALAADDTDMAAWWKEQWDAETEALDEAQDNMLSLTEEWAEAMKAIIENNMNQISDTLEKALTGGLGFDKLMDDFDKLNTRQEEYLTKTNQLYETNKLMRTANKALDETDNQAAKLKLKNFIDETKSLQENTQLSQYELEIQQAKYDLLLAEIALEEAQNAKATVRLSRDNEGNFGYVYTADQDAISDAQQQLDDAENRLYNKSLEGQQNYTEKYLQAQQEMFNQLDELWSLYYEEGAITKEEYEKRYADLQNHYYGEGGVLSTYAHLYNIGVQTDADATADNWQKNYGAMTQNTADWQSAVDTYYIAVQGQITSWEGVATTANSNVSGALNNSATATKNLTDESEVLRDKIVNGIIPAIDDELIAVQNQTDAYADQRDTLLQLIDAYEQYINQLNSDVAAANTDFDKNTDYSELMNEYLNSGGKIGDATYNELLRQRNAKIEWLKTQGKDASYWGTSGEDTTKMYQALMNGGTYEIKGTGEVMTQEWFKDNYMSDEKLKEAFATLEVPLGALEENLNKVAENVDKVAVATDEVAKSNTSVGEAVTSVGEAVTTSTVEAKDALTTNLDTVNNTMQKSTEDTVVTLETMTEDITNAIENMTNEITSALDTLSSDISNSLDRVSQEVSDVASAIGSINFGVSGLAGFASGGYTGDWGPQGKLAMLHEKELVLNAADTENLLSTIGLVREISNMIDIQASGASLFNLMATSGLTTANEVLEQNVTIHAEFPNATNHSEIEEAFNNLVNKASQYANRK